MKRLLFIGLALVTACQQHEPTTHKPQATSHFKVGLLTPGSVNDNGWNEIAYEGLLRIQKELGAEISHQETKNPAEVVEGFKSFGAKNYDLAFGHGFEFQDAAKQAGAQYPKTIFITTSGNTLAPNVAPPITLGVCDWRR